MIDYEPTSSLRSENNHFIYTPRTKTALAGRRFSSAAPAIWNNLPRDIRTCDDLNTFKRELKTHFSSRLLVELSLELSRELELSHS